MGEYRCFQRRAIRQRPGEREKPSRHRSRGEADRAIHRALSAQLAGKTHAIGPAVALDLYRHVSNRALQRLSRDSAFEVGPETERQLESNRGGGQPLSGATRKRMESAFGLDLGAVRVHADSAGAAISRVLSARAFAHGNDIYFASGEYEPDSEAGQRVLAHELAHVAQQSSGPTLTVGSAADPAEREADLVADQVVSALRAGTGRGGPDAAEPLRPLHRQTEEEEELAQPIRRQEEREEEELVQAVRRQPEEEEEWVEPLRRQEEEEMIEPLRRQTEEEDEEPVQTIR